MPFTVTKIGIWERSGGYLTSDGNGLAIARMKEMVAQLNDAIENNKHVKLVLIPEVRRSSNDPSYNLRIDINDEKPMNKKDAI